MSSALIRYGWELGKKMQAAEQKWIAATDFSVELFTDDKIYAIPATLIRLLPSRLGLFQSEFRDKDEIRKHPRAPHWSGGEDYYKDTGLQVYCNSSVMKMMHDTRRIIPTVQATASWKHTKIIQWKVQFEGVQVFDAGDKPHGPYTMKYLSGRKLVGMSKPIAASTDALETIVHHYFNH